MSNGPRNIILAGFMGTGKSAVGRRLARSLGWRFVDADDLIEQRAGKPITRIFAEDGEPAFRAIEAAVADDVARLERHVIATGGGMVVDPENLDRLRTAGTVVLLTATSETIWQRVRRATHRPLLQKPDPQGEIRRLLAERAAAYGRIEIAVATDDKSPAAVAGEIHAKVNPEPCK